MSNIINVTTVASALVALKLTNSKIEKATQGVQFCAQSVGNKAPTGFSSVEEFASTAKAKLQSITDLISYRNRLKSAIVASNASTRVQVGSVSMTVAEAIERKSSIAFDKHLLGTLATQMNQSCRLVDKTNADVQVKLDSIIASTVAKDSKSASEDTEAITKSYLDRNGAKLLDPLDLKKYIEALTNSIEEFEANVDLALTASNAVTPLTVS